MKVEKRGVGVASKTRSALTAELDLVPGTLTSVCQLRRAVFYRRNDFRVSHGSAPQHAQELCVPLRRHKASQSRKFILVPKFLSSS